MESVRHVTCTTCHWSLWTDEWAPYDAGDKRCPRCGVQVVAGRRPDDVYPAPEWAKNVRRDSDPAIAIREFLPDE